ncbi:hypothetical protein BCR43DRAFT_180780 [Syncephalastrum racemosum]|uniref:Uncharacterized protein n=1 Tax=Syncephalastrum racemosum TaxID=13706 RepID=A0A1X2HQC6_SYNRA|nr:hypothetical protein BCR43DRAFT_180780 [Syncephalastrum racemosum]
MRRLQPRSRASTSAGSSSSTTWSIDQFMDELVLDETPPQVLKEFHPSYTQTASMSAVTLPMRAHHSSISLPVQPVVRRAQPLSHHNSVASTASTRSTHSNSSTHSAQSTTSNVTYYNCPHTPDEAVEPPTAQRPRRHISKGQETPITNTTMTRSSSSNTTTSQTSSLVRIQHSPSQSQSRHSSTRSNALKNVSPRPPHFVIATFGPLDTLGYLLFGLGNDPKALLESTHVWEHQSLITVARLENVKEGEDRLRSLGRRLGITSLLIPVTELSALHNLLDQFESTCGATTGWWEHLVLVFDQAEEDSVLKTVVPNLQSKYRQSRPPTIVFFSVRGYETLICDEHAGRTYRSQCRQVLYQLLETHHTRGRWRPSISPQATQSNGNADGESDDDDYFEAFVQHIGPHGRRRAVEDDV